MIPRRSLLAAIPILSACRKPGTAYPGFAFVASNQDPSLVAVDLRSFTVKSRLILPAPASSLHAFRKSIFALSPKSRSIAVIDTPSLSLLPSLKLPAAPLTAIRRGSTLWCLLDDPPQLLPIALDPLKPARPIFLPAPPVAFDLSPQAPLACASLADRSVVFVDLDARLLHPPRLIDDSLGAVRFRSDGKAVFAAGLERRQLIALDTASRDVITQLPLSLSPDHFCMNPDGGQLFITGRGHDAVVIAYTFRTEIAQTSLSGRKPGDMAASSAPAFLFVSNPQAGSVTIFDITSQKVVAVTSVGLDPGPIFITPDQQFALVLNRASGDVAVIRIAAITPGRSKTAPLFTMIPVGPAPSSALITPA